MKYFGKILAALLVLLVCYFTYGFFELRGELFKVYDVPEHYGFGPLDADLLIVDFNTYSCGDCQSLHPVLLEAIQQDGRVRYLPRPIAHGLIWEETLSASVYAAGEQGKFMEMHNLIYEKWPLNNRKVLFQYAEGIGLDTEKLSRDMVQPEIIARVRENQKFFDAWGLRRTPTLLIGKKAIYGPTITPTVGALLEKFEKVRS